MRDWLTIDASVISVRPPSSPKTCSKLRKTRKSRPQRYASPTPRRRPTSASEGSAASSALRRQLHRSSRHSRRDAGCVSEDTPEADSAWQTMRHWTARISRAPLMDDAAADDDDDENHWLREIVTKPMQGRSCPDLRICADPTRKERSPMKLTAGSLSDLTEWIRSRWRLPKTGGGAICTVGEALPEILMDRRPKQHFVTMRSCQTGSEGAAG